MIVHMSSTAIFGMETLDFGWTLLEARSIIYAMSNMITPFITVLAAGFGLAMGCRESLDVSTASVQDMALTPA
jgi:hypothetical protein